MSSLKRFRFNFPSGHTNMSTELDRLRKYSRFLFLNKLIIEFGVVNLKMLFQL